MANQEHLDILRQGVEVWNQWRDLGRPQSTHPDLRGANLNMSYLMSANLNGSDLTGASLVGAFLLNATLIGANLCGATLIEVNLESIDLRNANLSSADLRGANFKNANLRGANLKNANLSKANFNGTNLLEANLSHVCLNRATISDTLFSYTNLSGVDFRYTSMENVVFNTTNLSGTNFDQAMIGNLHLSDIDLQSLKGLEAVHHRGPSTIGIDTIYRSGGNIPESFLRSAGVPETFITYARSLVNTPIEYYTCFISYSSKDQAFAERLYADLQNNNVRCWYAPKDMNIGDKIRPRIDESIRLYDKLLVILSENSVASSWVAYEVEKALNKEPKGVPNVLYPIRLDDAVLTCAASWAQDIRETRHIGDFERWKDHDHYQEGFKRLLRALTTKQPTKET